MKNIDQIIIREQAISLLKNMGYHALERQEATVFGNGDISGPLLKEILKTKLQQINRVEYKGKEFSFSNKNISAFISQLEELAEEGTPYATRKLFDLLLFGKSFEETIDGDKKSYTLKLIDWENIDNNQFHFASEFSYQSHWNRFIADLVLFVNGIPLVVIEFGKYSAQNAINRHIRTLQSAKGGSILYKFAQVLIAAHTEESKYGTVESPEDYWPEWHEDLRHDVRFWQFFHSEDRLPHSADQIIYELCRPQRLLEIVSRFILFGEGGRQIARYHQYFAVHETLEKITPLNTQGKRFGGHLRHPIGSGKLNTLMLLIRNIFLSKLCSRPRMIILSSLSVVNEQIAYHFRRLGESIETPSTARQLVNALRDENISTIATVLQKIATVAKLEEYKNLSFELFVFIDEIDGMHGGALYKDLREMFPNACYIGFTQMATLRESLYADPELRNRLHSYTLKEAVQDGILLPLLYEGKVLPKLEIVEALDAAEIDDKMLKWKVNRFDSSFVVKTIAFDITTDYKEKWRATGAKAMLLVPSVDIAIRFQEYFEQSLEFREKLKTVAILADHHERFEGETYIRNVYREDPTEAELFIVVNKLFAGLDVGRVDILYIARTMNPNQLVQAIGKVNRCYKGKEAGIVVDYSDIRDNLRRAVEPEAKFALPSADPNKAIVFSSLDKAASVKKRYKALSDLFPGGTEDHKFEHLASAFDSPDKRDRFFELLGAFERTFKLVMSTDGWQIGFAQYEMDFYRIKLTSFHELAQQLRQITGQNLQLPNGEKDDNPYFAPLLNLLLQHKIELPLETVNEYGVKILSAAETEPGRNEAFNKSVSMKLQNSWEDILIDMKKRFSLNLSYKEFDTFLAAFLKIAKDSC